MQIECTYPSRLLQTAQLRACVPVSETHEESPTRPATRASAVPSTDMVSPALCTARLHHLDDKEKKCIQLLE